MQDDYICVYNPLMLNYKWFFVFVLLCGLPFMAVGVYAQSPSLYTKDGKCRYYYFTPKNTQSWYIQASDGLCDDGIVDGQGVVTVYNAFSQPIEEIYGFFNEGFWTGDMPLSAPVLYQTVDSDSTQKVYFQIPNDTYYNFQLIGQMSSHKQKDGTYEAFKFCNPFRILLQTEESDLFTDDQKLIEIVDELVQKTRDYCPAEETLYFYASRLERPDLDDIFFFAEVDMRAARITIKRNAPPEKSPSDSLAPGMASPPIDPYAAMQNYSNSVAKNGMNGNFDNNMQGAPVQAGASSYMNGFQDAGNSNAAAQNTMPQVTTYAQTSKQETQTYIDLRNNSPRRAQANRIKEAEDKKVIAKKDGAAETAVSAKQAGTDDKKSQHTDKTSSKNRRANENNQGEQGIDQVPHLLLSSKIMRKPVSGTAVVYIADATDEEGRSNKPNPLKLEGKGLTVGWAVISGDFDYQSTSNSGKLRGKVLVKSVVPCQSKQCRDIK